MPKRKASEEPVSHNVGENDDDDHDHDYDYDDDHDPQDSSDTTSLLNVDFEWFDPQPQHDFPGLKTLLRQLFHVDHHLFHLSALADLILSQPTLGSTVKCEGNESDPYAFLTVLNMHQHRDKDCIKQLTRYLVHKSAHAKGFESLGNWLGPESKAQVGLVLTERFINMPHHIVPPMYTMLLEELQWAIDDGEPYNFTHYLIISKTYTEVASQLHLHGDRPSKKAKGKTNGALETFYFHPEDEVLHQHAIGSCNFEYTTETDEGASDSKRAFQELGVKPQGHLILIDAGKFQAAVMAVKEHFAGEA